MTPQCILHPGGNGKNRFALIFLLVHFLKDSKFGEFGFFCDSSVLDTLRNDDSAVYDTPRNDDLAVYVAPRNDV